MTAFDPSQIKHNILESVPAISGKFDLYLAETDDFLDQQSKEEWLITAQRIAFLKPDLSLLETFLVVTPKVIQLTDTSLLQALQHMLLQSPPMIKPPQLVAMMDSLILVAEQTQDVEQVEHYINLLMQLAKKSPRAITPMLSSLQTLLSKLTVSGLENWANWGVKAHARNFPMLRQYFSLLSADSKEVLQLNRQGLLFSHYQRSIGLYLRALWGLDSTLQPCVANHAGLKPYLENETFHLPDAVEDMGDIPALNICRAMAGHLVSHKLYASPKFAASGLTPQQKFYVAFIEDARVDHLAIQKLPGLKKLWFAIIRQQQQGLATESESYLLYEFSKKLIDPGYAFSDQRFNPIVTAFHQALKNPNEATTAEETPLAWRIGLLLQQTLTKEVKDKLYQLDFVYRDDNRFMWPKETGSESESSASQQKQNVTEADDTETTEAQSISEAVEEEGESSEVLSRPHAFRYPEWDYRIDSERPSWVSLHEQQVEEGSLDHYQSLLAQNQKLAARIKQIVDKLQSEGLQTIRKIENGDELDLNACVEAITALRMQQVPDPRITMRKEIKHREVSVVLLIDLSESTNDYIAGSHKTVIDVTQEATILLAQAIDGIGDQFAIHGFSSDGRHDLQYGLFKQFEEPYDDAVKARLANMQGGLSTRMGGAIRHAGQYLQQQTARHKLLLLITDGEPADIDETDEVYLKEDARKAVEVLKTEGIFTFCLTIDQAADQYVQNIFGPNRYVIIDDVLKLPEKLPKLFASLTS